MSDGTQITPFKESVKKNHVGNYITKQENAAVPADLNHQDSSLFFSRRFTTPETLPYDLITWERRNCEIKGSAGEIIFSRREIEVPSFWSDMAATVVASKYLRSSASTNDRESSVKELISRVVDTITNWGAADHYFASEHDAATFRSELTHILLHQYASFNSPVWFNLGVEAHPQCSACFILSVEDSMPSLLELQTIEGTLFKSGSGCGTNLSSIRSSRESLSGGGTASGPLSFMRGFDAWAGSIKSGGKTRRAAKMQMLDITHPDIIEFIRCKAEEEKKAWALIDAGYSGGFNVPGGAYDSIALQNANLSIRVSDEFMNAVVNDESFYTKCVSDQDNCEKLCAREVLRLAAECVHICGDPGIQYDTTINAWHTCSRSGPIRGSNPCSEYMHLDNSACNLASINLLKFLKDDGEFALEDFLHVVDLLICAQDILIGRSRYPTKKIERCAHDFRQIGLGYANLGALLMSKGLAYDSTAGRAWAAFVSSVMTAQAYKTSARLASSLGPFQGFRTNRKPMLAVIEKHQQAANEHDFRALPGHYVSEMSNLWQQVKQLGGVTGFRNSQVTVIAPTGTISFMMDCDTTGIEPDLALVKYKKLSGGGMLKIVNRSVSRGLEALGYGPDVTEEIAGYIEKNDTIEGAPFLKKEHLPVFDCAFKPLRGERFIHHSGHLQMMAAVQPFISGAISKTVNLPKTITVDEIFEVYIDAWKLGLKAVALYRDGSKRTQPLNTSNGSEQSTEKTLPQRRRLPAERKAVTHKFNVSGLEGYLTVGLYDDGMPGEIFLVVAKEGSTLSGVMDAFATSVSIALQYGVPLVTLAKKFTYTRFEPAGFTQNSEIPVAQSVIDYIFRWLSLKFLSGHERGELGIRAKSETDTITIDQQMSAAEQTSFLSFKNLEDAPPCTRCGSSFMVRQGGCYYCLNCGGQGGCG